MSFNSQTRYKTVYTNQATTAVVAGSTVGTAATNVVLTQEIEVGTALVAEVTMVVNTSSLTLTPKFQGSADGSTWLDLYPLSGTANVATAAGTGSNVTTTKALLCNVCGYKYVRVVFDTAGATAHASNDKYSLTYRWVARGYLG